MENIPIYKPKNKVRIVTAASLFDGHDAAINIIITDLTTISALKKRFIKEKSALDARPTACVEISASILNSFHTQMCH